MLKLSLRDLLWLALLIAGLTVWGIQHQRSARQVAELKKANFLRDPYAGPSADALQRRAALKRFAACTDEELDEQFATIAASTQWHHAADYEPCLTEMVRRRMVRQLQKHYDMLMARGGSDLGFPYNLELLTALRRAQGKPDPLKIEVSIADPNLFQIDGPAPAVKAAVTNVDTGREAVHFTRGGDYRGGRRDRWRAILTDERGRVVRDSNFQSMIGGGIASLGPFAYGENDADGHGFDLRRYVAPPRSGRYQLQLVYHNERDLASEPDLSGLIVTRSKPIPVTIHVPSPPNNGLRPGVQSLIAILAATATLSLATVIANRWRGPPAASTIEPTRWPRALLPRRDFVWIGLMIAVAIGAAQGDRYWINQIAILTPDANAIWSIEIDAPIQ
jgi:hypothetical protein